MIRELLSNDGSVSLHDTDQDGLLEQTLRHAYDHFGVYRNQFAVGSVTRSELADDRLHAAFTRLPRLEKPHYIRLQAESLERQKAGVFVVDPSSGTTSNPILKFASLSDDLAEAAAVKAAFETLALSPTDRCACIDIGASQIYLFYMRILAECGIAEPLFIKLTSDRRHSIEVLRKYQPNIIVSIPSVLQRCGGLIRSSFQGALDVRRKIVCIAEPIDDVLRRTVAEGLNGECFSFYGTTELGSMCIECSEHQGMHVPLELFIPTLYPWGSETTCVVGQGIYRGTVAWTSLLMRDQPAIKYAVSDVIEVDTNPCRCGRQTPRVKFQHRADEAFVIYGLKFSYQFFLDAIQSILDEPTLLSVRVTRDEQQEDVVDVVVLTLDESLREHEDELRIELTNLYPLSELLWAELVRLEFRFVAEEDLSRKTRRIVMEN